MRPSRVHAVIGLLLIFALACAGVSPDAYGQTPDRVFFTPLSPNQVQSVGLDGSSPESILSGLSNPADVAVHATTGRVFYAASRERIVYAVDSDGSQQTAISFSEAPHGLSIDEENGHLYVTVNGSGAIRRVDLDGSNLVTVVPGLDAPSDVAVHPTAGFVYWLDSNASTGTDAIYRSNLDGTNVQTVVADAGSTAYRLVLDDRTGTLYWTGIPSPAGSTFVRRVNADGSKEQDVVTSSERIYGLDIDTINDHLYFTSTNGSDALVRSDLDGGNQVSIATNLPGASGVSVHPATARIAVSDFVLDQILSVDAATGSSTLLDQAPLSSYEFVAMDANGLLYFADEHRGEVVRFSPDATYREVLYRNLREPVGITVDTVREYVYWSSGTGRAPFEIRRGPINGSGPVETVYAKSTGTDVVPEIDEQRSKLVWVEPGNQRIRRADLDGSNVETVADAVPASWAFDIRPSDGAIIWSNYLSNDIEIIQQDGTGRSVFVPVGSHNTLPLDLAINQEEGTLYWTASGSTYAYRASLNGATLGRIPLGDYSYGLVVGYKTAIPVELAAFDAQRSGEDVVLTWSTLSETNNAAFRVQRATDGPFRTLRSINGAGTTMQTQRYSFVHTEVPAGSSVTYRLQQVDVDGTTSLSEPQTVFFAANGATLNAPSPHPVQDRAKVSYTLPTSGSVTLEVFDLLGRRTATLVNREQTEGYHSVDFSARDLAAGTYFLRLTTTSGTSTQKITVVR